MIMPRKSSTGSEVFWKVVILVEILTNFETSRKCRKFQRRCFCSTSYSRGNQVDGSPRVAIGKTRPKDTATFYDVASLNMFLVTKTMLIWKCATWKMFFMYSGLHFLVVFILGTFIFLWTIDFQSKPNWFLKQFYFLQK